jgi:hypothetical protein
MNAGLPHPFRTKERKGRKPCSPGRLKGFFTMNNITQDMGEKSEEIWSPMMDVGFPRHIVPGKK